MHRISCRLTQLYKKYTIPSSLCQCAGEGTTCPFGEAVTASLLHILLVFIFGGVIGDPVVLFQETRLLPAVTALRNVACVSRDKEALAKAAALLRELGFTEEDQEKKPAELSGGMRQRVAIARALLFDHERGGNLVVLDEPFRGLDPSMKEKVAAMIAERFADKVTLLITHEAEDASLLGCDYRSFADLGKNN